MNEGRIIEDEEIKHSVVTKRPYQRMVRQQYAAIGYKFLIRIMQFQLKKLILKPDNVCLVTL